MGHSQSRSKSPGRRNVTLPPHTPASPPVSRRKSDLRPAVVAEVLKLTTVVTPPVISPPPMQNPAPINRARSALEPGSHRPVKSSPLVGRSKSMPVASGRRADINLDEETLAHVGNLQETLRRASLHRLKSLTEKELEIFCVNECSSHAFGVQSLTGLPGQRRAQYGLLPENVWVSCVKGCKGANDSSANQDNYSFCQYGEFELYCLQDGHGSGGHFVSYRGVRSLPYLVTQSVHFPLSVECAILEGYRLCHDDLVRHSLEQGYDIQISGAACVLVIRKKDKVWISHTGDSRVILGDVASPTPLFETVDHKPVIPAERLRLEASGSEIQTFTFDEGKIEIARVFVKGTDYPGLCMSRSIGDQSVKDHGVIPLPDIHSHHVHAGLYILLATDGIWEFIPSKLITASVAKKLALEGTEKCLNRIVTEAKKRWRTNEGNYCDDITAMMIRI